MPDHVHLFARPCCPGEHGLRPWVTWWKRLVARELGSSVWQPGVWDVRMRSAEQYAAKREYVRQNPVRAGLVRVPEEWPCRGKIHDLVWMGLSD
jgi:putative transposase